MRLYISIYLLVLFLFIPLCVNATDHYVDKNASGQNNGTSWTNAWESFSAINWSSIQPGDYLYVSGGTDSTVYYEEMTVGASGTSDNQITIIAGKYAPSPTGHDGRVIIDGGNVRAWTINADYISYITIKGFENRNATRGIAVRHTSVGCIIDSNLVTNFDLDGGIRIDGSGGSCNPADWDSYDHIIRNNTVITYTDVVTQTDGIYLQRTEKILVENNFVHERNASAFNSHSDGIQTHCVMNLKFINNVVIADSNVQGMPMVIRAESDGSSPDSVIFYNNLFYSGGNWWDGGQWLNIIDHQEDYYPTGGEPPTIMIHNTMISHGPFVWAVWKERHLETEKHLMINNIIAQYGDGDGGVSSQYWHGTFKNSGGAWVVDSTREGLYYNEYRDMNDEQTVTGNGNTGTLTSWNQWVNTYGGTGVWGDPLFVDAIGNVEDEGTLRGDLQSGSPAMNQGENLQSLIESMGLPWTDINGNPRDGSPDIGAYQYVPRGPDITPPEVTGATLLDSVTLKIMFSEALDESTAEDENNYSISNNIDIFNASLNGSDVTLQTSAHSPGSYIVTVVNVEDLAGNPIAQSNTAEYSRIPPIPADSLIMFTVEDVYGVIQEPEHTPLKTIDGLGALSGDPDSRWAAEPMPEELIFDLGTNKTVCKTKLSFNNWNYGRVYSYSILISSDNNNWITIVSQATSALQEEWTIEEFPAVDARYVKVHFINNNQNDWAGLWEGEIWGIITSIADPVNSGLPNEFSLHQNYPNPFNPTTTIRYSIPLEGLVTLKVYNTIGEEVIILANEVKQVGSYEVEFDASNLPSGIYFYRLQAGSFLETKKMVLMK